MSRSTHRSFSALTLTVVATSVVSGSLVRCAGCRASDPSARAPEVIVLNDNGAWSWFEDERAVVDAAHGTLLVSSVASAEGTDGVARHGNVEVVAYDLGNGSIERSVLHANLEADDHDSAALYVRPDGRYVAMYSMHATDNVSRWRVSSQAGDAADWEPERTLALDAPATYSNLYAANDGSEERVYAFVRTVGRDPHVLVSGDHGTTWTEGGRLLTGPGRPYVRYAADGSGRIHLITTEQHPRDFANGVYHGVIADGQLRRADGTVVDADVLDGSAVAPERLTEVFASADGERAWTVDLQVDELGHPYAAFSVQTRATAAGPSEHRYYYARFDGTAWRAHFLAYAGSELYPDEGHYTGLVALHPHDPWRVFVSTDVHPATGVPLVSAGDHRRHHELFEGVTADEGASWSWTPVTADSTVDNIRPLVPIWDEHHTALLWLRGTYFTYHEYDLDVVGIITR